MTSYTKCKVARENAPSIPIYVSFGGVQGHLHNPSQARIALVDLDTYNVGPPRQLRWFITAITKVFVVVVTTFRWVYKPTYN